MKKVWISATFKENVCMAFLLSLYASVFITLGMLLYWRWFD